MAEVTREHREVALAIIGASGSVQVQASEQWVKTGHHSFTTFDPCRHGLKEVAKAIAEAEARGRAAERADVAEFIVNWTGNLTEVERFVGHCLAQSLLSGLHVGAAGKAGG